MSLYDIILNFVLLKKFLFRLELLINNFNINVHYVKRLPIAANSIPTPMKKIAPAKLNTYD